METEKIKMGVSTCLLGEKVRYDGGHKLNHYITDTLGQFFEWVPVCPEVECGLSIPREAMHLEGEVEDPRLLTTKTRVDHTDRMRSWAVERIPELESEGLCGFIFKSNSPSSGMERVRLYDQRGVPKKVGVGLFAAAFMKHFPLLPVEEDGRLNDPLLRENFIERVFCLKRYRDFLEEDGSVGGLVAFHSDHKMLILSHHQGIYREMGRLVADPKSMKRSDLFAKYEDLLLSALQRKAARRSHSNVLQHMLGHFKKHLSADEKQEMLEIIDEYIRGVIPLIVPITLMRHYVRTYDVKYLARQIYLRPHPMELQLRNHA